MFKLETPGTANQLNYKTRGSVINYFIKEKERQIHRACGVFDLLCVYLSYFVVEATGVKFQHPLSPGSFCLKNSLLQPLI